MKAFIKAADIGRSRSSALNQLQWAMAILVAGICLLWRYGAPTWLIGTLASLLVLTVVVFLGCFIYFMVKRPHSLRSETFDLKMTQLIEKRTKEFELGEYEELTVRELKQSSTVDEATNREKGAL